jgi:hypothetical protein
MAAAYLVRRRRHAAHQRYQRQRTAFDRHLQSVLQWARAAKPIFKAWSGARPFRVAAVVDEALDCKSFYLTPVDGRPLPRFEAGQYLTFPLTVRPLERPVVRCYSLSERPREDYYRVTIKRISRPAPGQGSTYFHGHVQVGTTLDVQAPQGAFFLDPRDETPAVLVGAGIGITPIMSMINSIVSRHSGRKTYVFAGFRNSREQPFVEVLRELKGKHDTLRLDVSYSRPTPADRLGRDYDHRGRIDVTRLRDILPSNNFQFYICGPAALMESLVPALWEWGVPEEHVHFEAFGPASVQSLRSHTAVGPCLVEFARAGQQLTWSGEQASLLEFAEASGVALDFGCRAGNCGQCLISLREGKVTHVKKPGLPLGERDCLACVAVPQGDVVLEA